MQGLTGSCNCHPDSRSIRTVTASFFRNLRPRKRGDLVAFPVADEMVLVPPGGERMGPGGNASAEHRGFRPPTVKQGHLRSFGDLKKPLAVLPKKERRQLHPLSPLRTLP